MKESLEAALLRELAVEWQRLNHDHFYGGMRPPLMMLTDRIRTLGHYNPTDRTIGISRTMVRERSWGIIVEVLKHEMAHQYVFEVLRVRDETAHGPAFQKICARLGIDAAASGAPAASGSATPRIVRKVQRLLALAESPNVHEAQAAMRAAKRMMLRYNIDHASNDRRYGFRQLGQPMKRRPLHHKLLATILIEHFFVSGIWVDAVDPKTMTRGRLLEILGAAHNLEIAAWVHDYLLETADRLWAGQGGKRKDRRSFLSGVMIGVKEKLDEQSRDAQQAGLVWVKDADLDTYMRQRHPRIRTGRATSLRSDDALQQGRRAGRSVSLNRPLTSTQKTPRAITTNDS